MFARKILTTLLAVLTLSLLCQVSMAISAEMETDDLKSAELPQASAEHLVSQITLSPATPNILKFGDNVNISFSYNTTQAGGVRIFPRPMTGNALTPNYAASGSPLYPVGSGNGTAYFTITSGPVTVDKIRFRIYNADQSVLLYNITIPVHYKFR